MMMMMMMMMMIIIIIIIIIITIAVLCSSLSQTQNLFSIQDRKNLDIQYSIMYMNVKIGIHEKT